MKRNSYMLVLHAAAAMQYPNASTIGHIDRALSISHGGGMNMLQSEMRNRLRNPWASRNIPISGIKPWYIKGRWT